MCDVWKLILSILYKYGAVPSVAVIVIVDVFTVLSAAQANGVAEAEAESAFGWPTTSTLTSSQDLADITRTW